jgi:hypothetical protein
MSVDPSGGRERRAESLRRVQEEIRRTQAEALGRAGERLAALLDRLAAADRDLDARLAAPGSAARAGELSPLRRALDARNRLRDEAARARHYLIVQREALGLSRHVLVEERYPVPARRRLEGEEAAEPAPPGGGRTT